jgi:hypothetical protein
MRGRGRESGAGGELHEVPDASPRWRGPAGLALPALADPVFGLWRTEPDARGVGDGPAGRLRRPDLRGGGGSYDGQGRPLDSPHAGRAYLWDMEPRGSGRYRDGRSGCRITTGSIRRGWTWQGDQLTVTHCTLVVVCRDQVWWRAN